MTTLRTERHELDAALTGERAPSKRSTATGMRRRRLLRIAVAGAIVLVLGGATLWRTRIGGSGDGSSTSSQDIPRSTAVAEVRQLAETEEVDGTLGYAGARVLAAGGPGTITELPVPGTVVDKGQVLYRVDNRPVVLLFGGVPVYRPLRAGMTTGPDVAQLERNLIDLGFATPKQLTVDETFNAATTAAVKRWQKSMGMDQDGVVDVGDIVFLPGPARVGHHKASVGDAVGPGGPVMDVASTTKVVTVKLEARLQLLAQRGAKVRVKLADGTVTDGTIFDVGRVATTPSEDTKPTVDVVVTIDDPAKTGDLDQAPVQVTLTRQAHTVLSVPVNALLALRNGEFGVEKVDGSATRIVVVDTGLFAQGFVEISGNGIAPGDRVVVPA